jgi:hypothetical protein
MNPRGLMANGAYWAGGAFLLLLVGGGIFWWYFQPERALQRDWQRLLAAVEKRQWEKVESYLAEDYTDSWGQDRATALGRGEDVMRIFLFVNFATAPPVEADNSQEPDGITLTSSETARQRIRLQMSGSGGPLAAEWVRRFNQLPGSFTISWRRQPGWPPRWEVVSLQHDAAARWGY